MGRLQKPSRRTTACERCPTRELIGRQYKRVSTYCTKPASGRSNQSARTPTYDAAPDIEGLLLENSKEIREILRDSKTYVDIAGLIASDRFGELLYD